MIVTAEETAHTYIGKAVTLLETACKLYEFCDLCPLLNIETRKCGKTHIQKLLEINTQQNHT